MAIFQFTGLSGSGKTTLAENVSGLLKQQQISTAIIDGDVYRKTICKDLGFSREDRHENMRRLGAVAFDLSKKYRVVLIAAINPFEIIRQELSEKYGAKTIWIQCTQEILRQRDPKGLYKRALLPDGHPDKLYHFTGITDIYEVPAAPGLIVPTHSDSIETSVKKIFEYIIISS